MSREALGGDGRGSVLDAWRRRCLAWQEQNPEGSLERFTFIADVTALASLCTFAGDEESLVARYDGLPFVALAFCAPGPERLAALAGQLVAPGTDFYCLVGEADWGLAREAYSVQEVQEEYQMLFRGDAGALDAGGAVRLGEENLSEMAALARRESMPAFERDPLGSGPWYGVRRDGELVAQGGTHLVLERAAEIGNIVTARAHRRRGHASQVVVALAGDHSRRGVQVFLQVYDDNEAAIACYERLGFARLRRMMLARCRMRASLVQLWRRGVVIQRKG